MVYIHWRLVNNVSRSESQKEWQRTAVKVYMHACGEFHWSMLHSLKIFLMF